MNNQAKSLLDKSQVLAIILELDAQQALSELITVAEELAGIKQFTGRIKPDVIT